MPLAGIFLMFAVLQICESIVTMKYSQVFNELDVRENANIPIKRCPSNSGCYIYAAYTPSVDGSIEKNIHLARIPAAGGTQQLATSLDRLARIAGDGQRMPHISQAGYNYSIVNLNGNLAAVPLAILAVTNGGGNVPYIFSVVPNKELKGFGSSFTILTERPFTLTALSLNQPSKVQLFTGYTNSQLLGFDKPCEPVYQANAYTSAPLRIPVRGPLISVIWDKGASFSFNAIQEIEPVINFDGTLATAVMSPGFIGCPGAGKYRGNDEPEEIKTIFMSTSYFSASLAGYIDSVPDTQAIAVTNDQGASEKFFGTSLIGKEQMRAMNATSLTVLWPNAHNDDLEWMIKIQADSLDPIATTPESTTQASPSPGAVLAAALIAMNLSV